MADDSVLGAEMVGSMRLAVGVMVAAVSAAAPAMAQSDILFQAESQTLTGICAGQAVRLEGNHNHVALSGVCGSLLVKGLANSLQLTVAPGASIRVEGAQNHVQYAVRGSAPTIVMLGPDNEVTSASMSGTVDIAPPPVAVPVAKPPPPAAPAPKPAASPIPTEALTLSGDDEEKIADCGGRDVLVTGNRSAYVIRGTCHSLVVRGDLLTVQAILQPSAKIAVSGRGVIVSWAVPGRGHAPVGTVHGAGSHIQRADAIGGQVVK